MPINSIDNQLTAAVMDAPLAPEEIKINSLKNDFMGLANQLSTSESQGFKAHLRTLSNEGLAQIADLRRKKISEKELHKAMQEIEVSFKSSANRYLANCQSYQRMKGEDETAFREIDEKIQRKKIDLSSWAAKITVANESRIAAEKIVIDTVASAAKKTTNVVINAVGRLAKSLPEKQANPDPSPKVLHFPSQETLSTCLKKHPLTSDPYLAEKEIIGAMAGAFANQDKYPAGVDIGVMIEMDTVNEKLKLRESAITGINLNLTSALKDCADGEKK